MKVGIVGLPGTGKTTVFTALTGVAPEPGAPPGRTTLGIARVRDPRLEKLARMFPRDRTVAAEVTFADVAGTGGRRGLDRAVLTSMRGFDAFAQVLRAFQDPGGEPPDPVREMGDLDAEVVLADLETVERKHSRLAKGEKETFGGERDLVSRLKEALETNRPLRELDLTPDQKRLLSGYAFLSLKPVVYVLNAAEDRIRELPAEDVVEAVGARGARLVVLSADVERQIAELEEAEQAEFLADLGLDESAAARFIRAAYTLMDLISFFTIGDDEVRAWTIPRGTNAQTAAGKIHTDMERGFIRAEVMRFEDLAELGSEAKCREAGKFRLEGKAYVVQDGDVLRIRFGV